MATQQQVIALLRAAVSKKQSDVRSIGLQIKAGLESHGRHEAARTVERILNGSGQMIELDRRNADLIWWEQAERSLDSVRLDCSNRKQITAVLRDNQHVGALVDSGLKPRRFVMLDGPSGTGKTSLARAMAYELQRPFGIIRLGSLIDSHMGATGGHLERIWAQLDDPAVILFDEWDAISAARSGGDGATGKETNRIVATLLTLMERTPVDSMIIAATNLPEVCDHAFLRRFDVRLTLNLPSRDDLTTYAVDLTAKFQELNLDATAMELGHSYATAEQAVLNAARDAVIARIAI